MMNDQGKSDRCTVPAKPPNKAEGLAAEVVEGERLTEGNASQRHCCPK